VRLRQDHDAAEGPSGKESAVKARQEPAKATRRQKGAKEGGISSPGTKVAMVRATTGGKGRKKNPSKKWKARKCRY